MVKNWTPWLIGGVVVLLLYQQGFFAGFGGQATPKAVCPNGVCEIGESSSSCPADCKGIVIDHITEDTTITLSCVNRYIQSNRTTEEYVRVFVDGFDEGQISCNDGTTDGTPGDDLTLYFGENSTIFYTTIQKPTLPDKGQVKYEGQLCQWDTSPTRTFFDEFDRPNTAQAMAAGEKKTLGLRYKAQAKMCMGNPESTKGVLICLNYNSSVYDKVEIPGLTPSYVPKSLATWETNAWETGCYVAKNVADNVQGDYDIVIEASSTDPTTLVDYINVTYVDADFDLNADDSSLIDDYQDEDKNDLGYTTRWDDYIQIS